MKLTFDVPEEMAKKIAEDIKAALEEYKKKQIWPQKGNGYYYITPDGGILYAIYDDELFSDKDRLEFGNIFKTKEEAEFKREQLKVLHELEQLADDDQPWNGVNEHVCLQYDWSENKCLAVPYFRYATYSPIHFKSTQSCLRAIDKIGEERLKKYYFCIPEEE